MNRPEPKRTATAFGRVVNLTEWMRAAGIILLITGVQAFVFARQLAEATDGVPQALVELEHEHRTDSRMNEALRALQLYWRASDDSDAKRAIRELRDTVLEQYGQDRSGAVEALRTAAGHLDAQTPAEHAARAELRLEIEALAEIYAERTGVALRRYTNPPWYLQPTASLLNDGAEKLHALRFNHALYLTHSGDPSAAATLLGNMRDSNAPRAAEVSFALARLAFERWTAEPHPALFAESLERATRSVRGAADNPLPKLFLEYLLSLDRSVEKLDLEPEEGQGEGEGRGERGVTPTERREF